MSDVMLGNRLDRPVDEGRPYPGPANAAIALVEYGSYACPYCRRERADREVRDRFGDRMRYVFFHRPLVGVELPAAPPNWWSGPRTPKVSVTRTSS